MWRGGVLSLTIMTVLCLLTKESFAGERPTLVPRTFELPRLAEADFTIDPAGVRGALSRYGPRPLSFRPSISLGWQATKHLRIGPELRHGGGSSVIVGIGFCGTLPW